MKYCIDRIEDNIAVLENLETQEMIDISLDELPEEIKDGTVLKYVNDKYELDLDEEEQRSNEIEDLFNSLKKN